MCHNLIKSTFTSLSLLFLMSVLLGLLYPGLITTLAQTFFPHQANGSLIQQGHAIKGSVLIGQYFQEKKYFWGRPSETSSYPYNALASSGSNLSLTNPTLVKKFKDRLHRLKQAHPYYRSSFPVDLITASGSGLDPDISVEAARLQAERVARARGIPKKKILEVIEKNIIPRQWGFLGESRVNVLKLNIALDTPPMQ